MKVTMLLFGSGEAQTTRISFELPRSCDVEAIAQEVFDLTNNPARADEAVDVIGPARFRSLSVGDAVLAEVNEGEESVAICLSCGWHLPAEEDADQLLQDLERAEGYFQREEVLERYPVKAVERKATASERFEDMLRNVAASETSNDEADAYRSIAGELWDCVPDHARDAVMERLAVIENRAAQWALDQA